MKITLYRSQWPGTGNVFIQDSPLDDHLLAAGAYPLDQFEVEVPELPSEDEQQASAERAVSAQKAAKRQCLLQQLEALA